MVLALKLDAHEVSATGKGEVERSSHVQLPICISGGRRATLAWDSTYV